MTTALSPADAAARLAAQGPVRTARTPKLARKVLERFPASAPRGSWPAEEFAADRRRDGVPARVVMDLDSDSYLVIIEAAS
ncbi:hypothetical protein [Streptomyces chartreusis]|uniref:hypothetical protein n=1 Tax=Streptomyces chartreusis TaxID=1969 RepID=UPI00123CBAC0|nr:hypothetical protein [Streptomyces chartreusis]QEV66241.1 hypothetical protein CP983_05890 [Streptomyces chartreusis]GGW98879.1 hypothetical protein GCM10010321_11670 [Streptomyces chartreusis]